MKIKIMVRNIDERDAVEALVEREVTKLERLYPALVSCRVVVEKRVRHPQGAHPYFVQIDVKMPQHHEIVVKRQPEKHSAHVVVTALIRDAFTTASRQLKKIAERWRPKERQKRHKNVLPDEPQE